MQHRRPFLLAAMLAASLAAASLPVAAQDYPNRPVRIVVPFSPGGAVDGPTRIVAHRLGERLTSPDASRK